MAYVTKGFNKLGAGIEAGLTLASATATTVVKALPAIAGHKEGSDSQGALSRDAFDGPRRARVLTSPQRALDTLEPYGKLHVDVYAGKGLAPKDEGLIRKTSDPFVEVYLNDVYQGTSVWRAFTNNPTWNYRIALDIYSPLAIVRVQVVDRDNLKTNDLIGFVEFCVADLELNSEVHGWFELRNSVKFSGLAPLRMAGHMRQRDDAVSSRTSSKEKRPSSTEEILGRLGRFAHAAVAAGHADGGGAPHGAAGGGATGSGRQPPARSWSLPLPEAHQRPRRPFAPCCGRLPLDEAVPESPREAAHPAAHGFERAASGSISSEPPGPAAVCREKPPRLNGGEVHMRLRLEAREEDEWYAFCLPPPEFEFMPDVNINLGELYMHIIDVKNLFKSICQKAVCVPTFIATWQCWQLTLAFLLWWLLAWLRPIEFLPMFPLWFALLLQLLRQEKWNKRLLWHSNVAPLDQDGFFLVAAHRDTSWMEAWIIRLLRSLGSEAYDSRKLRDFAGLTFRDGKPVMSFDALVSLLLQQTWVQGAASPPRCFEGHLLVYEGCTPSKSWTCRYRGGCQHPLTNKFKASVSRYHCSSCRIDLCEPCVAQMCSLPPAWAGIPVHFLPPGVVVVLTRLDQYVDGIHKALNACLDSGMGIPLDEGPASSLRAKQACMACVVAWLVLAALFQVAHVLSDEAIGVAFRVVFKMLGLLVITLPLVMRTSFALTLATQFRANAELKKYKQRRAAGGCATHWAFFTPEAAKASRPSDRSEASKASRPSDRLGGLTAVKVVP